MPHIYEVFSTPEQKDLHRPTKTFTPGTASYPRERATAEEVEEFPIRILNKSV